MKVFLLKKFIRIRVIEILLIEINQHIEIDLSTIKQKKVNNYLMMV